MPRENSFDILVDTRQGPLLETVELDAEHFHMLDLPSWRNVWDIAKEKRMFYQERERFAATAVQQLCQEASSGQKKALLGMDRASSQLQENPPAILDVNADDNLQLLRSGFKPLKKYVDNTLVTADAMMLWKNFAKRGKMAS